MTSSGKNGLKKGDETRCLEGQAFPAGMQQIKTSSFALGYFNCISEKSFM